MEMPNYSYINNLSGGDKEFEKQLLDIIRKELPGEVDLYSNFLSEKKFEKAAEVVHKIKHKISILGLEKSYVTADTYENDLKNGETVLQDDFHGILKVIADFLEEH